MSFSATDAAFEGFRLVRRRPSTVLWWAAVYLLFFALFFGLGGRTLVEIMSTVQGLETGGEPSMAELQSLALGYLNLFSLGAPLGLAFGAVLNAAVARAVLRPEAHRFGYLRVGRDELRVLGVNLVVMLIVTAASVVIFGVAGLLAGLAAELQQPWLWLVVVLLGLAGMIALAWLMARFSMAVPLTLDRKRFTPLASWTLTRGRVWPLVGMAVLAMVMALLVSLMGSIVALPVQLLTGGGLQGLAAFEGQSVADIMSQAGPAILAWVVLNSLFSALQLGVVYAPFSEAYRHLKTPAR